MSHQLLSELKSVLRVLLNTESVCTYSSDFNNLWDRLATGNVGGEHAIIWDETPIGDGGDVDTSPFVSPLHWAIGAAAECCATGHDFRVTILDLKPRQHREQIPLWRAASALSREHLGWLKLVAVSELGGERDRRTFGSAAPAMVPKSDGIRILADLTRLELSDPANPDNRHSIANLVAPLVLLGGTLKPPFTESGADGRTAHVNAIRTLLLKLGLLHQTPNTATRVGPNRKSPFDSGTRLILLDDQWAQGWGEWVCREVGMDFVPLAAKPEDGARPQRISGPGDIEVYAASDPSWLVSRLERPRTGIDSRFAFTLSDDDGLTDEVLLLDLRLFAGNIDREREFIKRLIGVCKGFKGTDHSWPGFGSDLDDAEQWCNDPASFSDERREGVLLATRSFLGRLLALIDFSLPVVIFSSTGDRLLIERFLPYGNIITAFMKPRTFAATRVAEPDDVSSSFHEALRGAARLARARRFLRKNVLPLARSTRQLLQSAHATPPTSHRYAELYVDETWGTVKRVGGYSILYDDETTGPAALWTQLQGESHWGFSREQLIDRGVRPLRFQSPAGYKLKASSLYERGHGAAIQELSQRATAVRDAATRSNALVAACVVDRPGSDKEGLPLGPDLSYRILAAAVVEIFLYDWLPALELALGKQETISAGVFLGTRIVPSVARELIRHQWDFGQSIEEFQGDAKNPPNAVRSSPGTAETIGYSADGPVTACDQQNGSVEISGRSMNFEDAYSLVLAIARQRGQGSRVRRATAVAMREYQPYPRKKLPWPPQLPRQIHYASDDLLHDPTLAPDALKIGFSVSWSNDLPTLLQASRLLDSKATLPEALKHLETSWSDSTIESARKWVAVRAEAALQTMGGGEFVRFALDTPIPVASETWTPRDSSLRTPRKSTPKAHVLKQHKPAVSVDGNVVPKLRYRLEIGPFESEVEAQQAREAMPPSCEKKRVRKTAKGKFMATSEVSGINSARGTSKQLAAKAWKVSYTPIQP